LLHLLQNRDLEIYLSAGLDIIEDYEQNIDPDTITCKMRQDFKKITSAPIIRIEEDHEHGF
jgi:hypothetical protein